MHTRLLVLAALLGSAIPAQAQDVPPDETPRAGQLRRQIEDRFAARVQEELGLTDQQASRMRDVVGGYFVKRRGMEAEERRLRQALAGELRPGVAANKENVARLTDQLLDGKVRYTQSFKDEVKDLSAFLDPVQVAQFLILRERLLDRIRRAQDERQEGPGLRRRVGP
jgi:Spy/CpxP family protein refolding chaperone